MSLLMNLACQEHSKDMLPKTNDKVKVEQAIDTMMYNDVQFPALWQAARVMWSAKHSGSPEEWRDIIFPFKVNEGFDAKKPKLGAAELSCTDRARIFNRIAIHDKLLTGVSQGQSGAESVARSCKAIISVTTAEHGEDDPILCQAVHEVHDVATFLLALLEPEVESESFMEKLDVIMKSQGDESSRTLIQKGVQQQEYYRNLERDLRRGHMGCKTLLPEVAAQLSALQGDNVEARAEAVRRSLPVLPVWIENLPAPRMAPVWAALQSSLTQMLELAAQQGACKQAQEVHQLCQDLLALPGAHLAWCKDLAKSSEDMRQGIVQKELRSEVGAALQLLCDKHTSADRVCKSRIVALSQ